MERLAELRERRALTLRELSAMSGVAADTINQIELGHRKPRPSTLRKLAKALNIEPQELTAPKDVVVDLPPLRMEASLQPVTVSVSLELRWNVAEALRSGRELDPDERSELEEAARAQLTAS
jgi:transcriptional regulator with XRE-family HTH domain